MECLRALGNIRESVVVALRALQVTSSNAPGILGDLRKLSKQLDEPLAASLNHCISDIALNPYIHHSSEHDGFQISIRYSSICELDVRAGQLSAQIRETGMEIPNEQWLFNEADIRITQGLNITRLSTKVTIPTISAD